MVLGEVAMLIIYFGVFFPIGLLLRLFGQDLLHMRLDRQANSYWQPKQQPQDVSRYYRQS